MTFTVTGGTVHDCTKTMRKPLIHRNWLMTMIENYTAKGYGYILEIIKTIAVQMPITDSLLKTSRETF